MKKIILQKVVPCALLFLGTLFFFSCNKAKNAATAAVFTWTVDGTTYTADSVVAYSNDIEARKFISGGEVKHVEVALHSVTDFPAGTHTLGTGANIVGFWNESSPFGAPYSTSGTLHITSNASGKISGDFTASFNNGSTMTCTFTNVPLE